MRNIGTLTAGGAITIAALLAAGCSSSAPVTHAPSASPTATHSASPVGSATPSPSATPTATPVSHHLARCQSSQLRLMAGPLVSEATQQETLTLVFRNVSATVCDMRGYPGIALLDSKGANLPFRYRRHGDQMLTSMPPALVAVAPGAAAYAAINQDACVARVRHYSARVKVTLPGNHGVLVLRQHHYPELGYCGPGDPSHVVDITPIEPALTDVFAQH
ncbi:MAG: DUF4232 domain-containing protein [Streptosporangiaceae bacterium]